jgi:Protein of unknown function (DUF3577)
MTTAISTVSTASSATTNGADAKFYDLLTRGVGFVSRIRDVTGRRKNATASVYCTVSVPLDPKGTPNTRWTNFDVRVCGLAQIDLINSMRDEVSAGRKPAIEFTVGDIYGDAFNADFNGQATIRAQYKGRLIKAVRAEAGASSVLTTTGLGYVNDIRFDHDGGIYADIGAIHGAENDLNTTYFQVRIETEAAGNAILDIHQLKESNPKGKFLVGFVLNAVFVEGFAYADTSDKKGQLGTNSYALLTDVRWTRFNGTVLEKQVASVPDDSAHQDETLDVPPQYDNQDDDASYNA